MRRKQNIKKERGIRFRNQKITLFKYNQTKEKCNKDSMSRLLIFSIFEVYIFSWRPMKLT